MTSNPAVSGDGNTPLKEFQTTADIKRKASPDFGKEVARNVASLIQNSYFTQRNKRFSLNRALANGRMDLTPIKAQFRIEADNYTELSFKAIMVVSTIISRLVGRWMQNREKLEVKAVDDYSEEQRKKEYEEAEFTMNHADMLAHLQEKTGLPMVAQNQYIPEDKEDLDLWKKELQRLPEEILFEQGENDILEDSGWFDIIKEKCLKDTAEVGLIACEVESCEDGEIKVKYILPESTFYSDSDFPDFRDASLKGYEEAMKIIDIRACYPNLPEETYWQLAQQSSQFNNSDLRYKGYDSAWNSCEKSRPYDDYIVPVLKYWLKTINSEVNQRETTRYGSVRIYPTDKPNTANPNKSYITKDEYTIYKGVFVKGTEVLLEWGEQKNMIRPHDPQESGNAECPLCLIMYNQQNMRNLAVPEKIEYPVEQMLVTLFKIQQLVIELVPPGNAYDVNAMRELNLGTGNVYEPLELKRMYKQTGDFFFSGKDAEGQPLQFPITPLANATAFQQLQGLITTYNFYQQVLRDEVGINENAEGQTPKARVTTDNYQSSVQLSYNATDYMYNAYLYLMEDAGKKAGCLLWNSVRLGAKAYRKLMKVQDVQDRIFKTRAKMLPTEEQQQYLDSMVNQAMVANPNIILYLDPFKVRRLAKDNTKLAEQYFFRCQRKAIQGTMEQAQQNAQLNSQAQVESAKAANEGMMQLEQLKAQIAQSQQQQIGLDAQKAAVLNMFTALYSKGEVMPAELQPLGQAVIQNIMLPLLVANQQEQQAIMQQMQAAQQPPQDTQQQQPQQAQQPEQQPAPQMA